MYKVQLLDCTHSVITSKQPKNNKEFSKRVDYWINYVIIKSKQLWNLNLIRFSSQILKNFNFILGSFIPI